MLTAEQKVRMRLTGSPFGEPEFQHEGEAVVRWITGALFPTFMLPFILKVRPLRYDVRSVT